MNEDEDYRHRLGGSKGASEGEGDSVADDDEDGEDDDYDEEDDSSVSIFFFTRYLLTKSPNQRITRLVVID